VSTRSIVTTLPDIVCEVCGRHLLRGEHPDVFLAGGRRRNVCELCAPRAVDGGWLRESDDHSVSLPAARQRRGRGLLERLRQLREPPAQQPDALVAPAQTGTGSHDFFEPAQAAPEPTPATEPSDQPRAAVATGEDPPQGRARPVPAVPLPSSDPAGGPGAGEDATLSSGEMKALRALEVFNAGQHPRRMVGIARSLGVPSVSVKPLAESGSMVSIVISWELCWYRYMVDLGDETAGATLTAQGTELSELHGDDRPANAQASTDGRLSLVHSPAQ
jgi:hypothetical protein